MLNIIVTVQTTVRPVGQNLSISSVVPMPGTGKGGFKPNSLFK